MSGSKQFSFLLLLFATSFAENDNNGIVRIRSQKFIDSINSKQKEWTAGKNFHENFTSEDLKSLTGVILEPEVVIRSERRSVRIISRMRIPEYFDARENWRECKWIKHIQNQGRCNSCWAFAATSTMSDRLCIHTKGKVQKLLSNQDLLECCSACYDPNPCNSGYTRQAWKYYIKKGLRSHGCKPFDPAYFLKRLGQNVNSNETCHEPCTTWHHRPKRYFGRNHYYIAKNVQAIQTEIMENGPVQVTIEIYDDLATYKKGVYSRVSNSNRSGWHSIKLIGWGVENGIPYWLCVNSWGRDWGLFGYIKIRRGVNMVDIESSVEAGMPLV